MYSKVTDEPFNNLCEEDHNDSNNPHVSNHFQELMRGN